MTNERSIKFLTLNCWGIPCVSKDRNSRMAAIAEFFVNGEYDTICLQEVWSVNDFKMIRSKVQERLPYSHYFFSGVLGSGLCIFTRYKIEDVMFHRWPLNGYVHKIHHGDWFGGKGVGLCRIKVQNINVNVYVAHLHAEYNKENDEYMAHRVLQAFDTAQFIRMTSGGADAVILGGDLNTEPQDLAYKIILSVAGLTDACSSSMSNLGTNECAKNSYTSSKVARTLPEGKRIDHILFFGSRNLKINVADFKQPFPNRIPEKSFSYSDHEAIAATFKFTTGENEAAPNDAREFLKEAVGICDSALKSMRRQRFWYSLFSGIMLAPLVWSMGLECSATSIGVSIALNIGRILLTAILCYTLFMSSIWNKLEKNALKAGSLGMELHLLHLNNKLSNK